MSKLLPLTKVRTGRKVSIAAVDNGEDSVVKKLAVLGILPGVQVTVLQTQPVYVLKVEYTQIAIERRIAEKIYILEEWS